MTAEKKVILIIVITALVFSIFGMLVQKKLHVCKEAPCKLDSLVAVINIRDSVNLNLKEKVSNLEVGKAISDNNHANQIYLLRNEIHALTDSTRLLFFKDFATGNNIRTSAVRFSNK